MGPSPPSKMARQLFFTQFLKNIKEIGSITPSSRYLVNRMLDEAPIEDASIIVELGAGTGCFTTEILNRMKPDATLYAFEINNTFCDKLNTINDKRLHVINDSAEHIKQHTTDADIIVSGMPYASLPKELGNRILAEAKRTLKPDGYYLQYQYSLVSKKKIKKHFPHLRVKWEPRNIPPAFFYTCKKEK